MAERLPRRSTSPDSIVSEFSSHDSTTTAPSSFNLSVGPSLRSSQTLANLCHATDTLESQSLFLDDFGSKLSSDMRRWQSNAENLHQQFNSYSQPFSPKPTYLVNDSLTNTNVPTSSMYDVLVGPRGRLPTSASLASLRHSIYAANSQQSSLSAMTHSTDQLTMSNENLSPFSSASLFLPLPTPTSNRPLLSAMENITDNDQQRVPYLLMGISSSSPSPTYGSHLPRHEHNMPVSSPSSQQSATPQVFRSTGRTNSMASWRGYLPTRFERMAIDPITSYYSQKLFLGGIPAEVTEAELLLVLRTFGKCNIKWPKNDGINENMPGFCHVIYRESRSVCELLRHCTRQQGSTIDYFLHIHMGTPSPMTPLPTRTSRLKPIQVVPWNVRDNVYVMQEGDIVTGEFTGKDWSRTIFVSPLHGKMTSYSLATIMAYVFGPVSMAQINTDKYGYPTGTGTVLFSDSHSYMRAVASGAIDIKCDCFHKLLDIDPFLRENETCAYCLAPSDRFCRNFHCLRSYCEPCWKKKHGPKPLADHQPATRRQQPLHHL